MISNYQNLVAIGLALVASAVLSYLDNYVVLVSQESGLWQFQVVRTLFAVPVLIFAARVSGRSIRPVNLPRLVARSLAVSTGLLIYFAALGALPVAQAAAGLFSAPLWVAVLSVFLFRQKIGGVGAFAIALGFVGALVLLQPELQNLTAFSLMPLSAGLFYGLGMMLTRYWCSDENPLTLTLGIFLTIGSVGLVMLVVVNLWPGDTYISAPWVTPSAVFLRLTFYQAIGAVVAVSLLSQAYRMGNPALIAVFEYSFLIFASFWAFVLWGSETNTLSWLGIAIIVVSGVLMAISSRRNVGSSET